MTLSRNTLPWRLTTLPAGKVAAAMTRLVAPALFLSLALALPLDASSLVGSWNIRNLGWDTQIDMAYVSKVASAFDLLAVQEIMSEDGAEGLRTGLEAETGVEWELLLSEALGRGSYREHYGFLWRPDRIEWVDGAVVYLDDDDVFAREPFAARFRTQDGFTFVMTSIHLIYGDAKEERRREVQALRSFRLWLDESFPETPVFLAGDFNLAPSDPAWAALADLAIPLITEGNTTISPVDGRFANLYDNIWAPVNQPLPIAAFGSYEFPGQLLGIDHEAARAQVSDHIPVWMEIDVSSGYATYEPGPAALVQGALESAPGSGDLPAGKVAPAIIGNLRSGIYHLERCPGYAQTSTKNRIEFMTEQAAISGGFRRAKNC